MNTLPLTKRAFEAILEASSLDAAKAIATFAMWIVNEGDRAQFQITNCGLKKIGLIKDLRDIIPDLGLKEAKDISEGAKYTCNLTVYERICKAVDASGGQIQRII